MMHGHEKSDPAIVAVKPANKAKKSTAEASAGKVAAEPGERRAGTKGNAGQQSTCRAQNRISVSQALERIRQFAVTHPRWEPYAGKPHVRFCAGGACDETHVPTATTPRFHHLGRRRGCLRRAQQVASAANARRLSRPACIGSLAEASVRKRRARDGHAAKLRGAPDFHARPSAQERRRRGPFPRERVRRRIVGVFEASTSPHERIEFSERARSIITR